LFVAVLAASSVAQAAETDDAVLRRVADGIMRQTTRRLIDRSSGQTFTDSTAIEPRAEVSIESKFNAWFYQTWLLADGMRRTAAALHEPRYENYGEQNLAFIYQHMPYFQRQHDAHITAAPVGDGKLSPIGFCFQISALWQTGLSPLVVEEYARTGDKRYEPYLGRIETFLRENPRFEDGTLYRKGKGMMTDDPYMTVPYLLRQWKRTGESQYLDDAVQQVMGTHERLFDRQRGVYMHLLDLKTGKPAGVAWGRGNGWMVLAHMELLAWLPQDHPRKAEVLAAFVRHMEGLRRWQDKAGGGWHQVLDHEPSWIETSCTGMSIYGLARGVNEGWIDASFAADARRGWEALKQKVTDDGDLIEVCGSTDTGDLK
jgi:hypothetical protein